MNDILTVRDLSVHFRQGKRLVQLVDRVSFSVARGECLGILGESGSGKSMACKALLDLLADYPGDEDVFQFALEQFKTTRDKRGLYAGYLAKLDDDRALEHLLDVAEGDDVTYSDFIEIRSAIERLGSEAPVRDWSHDPTYRAFRRLQKV